MVELRAATQTDEPFLWEMLATAGYEPSVEHAKARHVVAMHLEGWMREGDFGVIASEEERLVGAAWARLFRLEEKPTFYVDDRTPEVTVAVSAAARGRGVGTRLLLALIEEAASRGMGGLMLNVRDTNPALRLYERLGFRRIEGAVIENRVGGQSFGMARSFTSSGSTPK